MGKLNTLLTVGVVGGIGYLAYKLIRDPLGFGGIGKGISDFFRGGTPVTEYAVVSQTGELLGGGTVGEIITKSVADIVDLQTLTENLQGALSELARTNVTVIPQDISPAYKTWQEIKPYQYISPISGLVYPTAFEPTLNPLTGNVNYSLR